MNTTSTGRGLALAAGALAAGGALAILLQDALRTWDWQLEHALIPVLMAVQILTAHSVVNACRARRWGSAIGFAVVAAVGTWGVLYTSVGKQTKVAAEITAAAGDVNELRADLKQRLAANQVMLDDARAKMAAECATGRGKRCAGIEATVKVYEDAVAGNMAALAKAGPSKPVAANADKMAELLALVTGMDRGAIKHTLLLLEPFTYATIFELAALVSFGFAFGVRSVPRRVPVEPHVEPEPSPEARRKRGSAAKRVPASVPVEPGSTDDIVVSWVREFRARHGRNPRIPELRQRFDLPKTTAWRRCNTA